MMSQNRQAAIDRAARRADYQINEKAELEIELFIRSWICCARPRSPSS